MRTIVQERPNGSPTSYWRTTEILRGAAARDNGKRSALPEISRFLGIVIAMFYNDHEPPHFHVRYGERRAIVAIDTLVLLEGSLPSRVLGLVIDAVAPLE